MERVILHCDANSYYASVECLYTPQIREKPVAVGGDVAARHGIILTKNPLAKSFGVKTGEPIWQAKQKCPDLVCVPPDFPLYMRFSQRMRKLYESYSDRVEPFGLDEAWLDLSGRGVTLRDGARIADEIRCRVKNELGITISVGVANNKVFAKLGSDMKKPDAVTALYPENYARQVAPLSAGELLYVGPSTQRRLASIGVYTIGDLARCSETLLTRLLGKNGALLKAYASGSDTSPVMPCTHTRTIQSVGNSTTPPRDLENAEDVRCLCYLLAESVCARLRDGGFRAQCVQFSLRNSQLVTRSSQTTLTRPSSLTDEISSAAFSLFEKGFADGFPYRSIGLSCSRLSPDDLPIQLDFTGTEMQRLRQENLERSIDGLRRRFGHGIVTRGVVLSQRELLSPVEEHIAQPMRSFTGKEGT